MKLCSHFLHLALESYTSGDSCASWLILCYVQNGDSVGQSLEKARNLDDVTDKMKPWKLTEIVDAANCRLVTMPDSSDASNRV